MNILLCHASHHEKLFLKVFQTLNLFIDKLASFLEEVQSRTAQDSRPLRDELIIWSIDWCHEMKFFCFQIAFRSLLQFSVISGEDYDLLLQIYQSPSRRPHGYSQHVLYFLRRWGIDVFFKNIEN